VVIDVKLQFKFSLAVALGGKIAPFSYSTKSVETYIPSATQDCFAILTPLPEILTSPFAVYDGANIVYCGKNSVIWLAYQPAPSAENTVLSCYRLASATGVWTQSTALSTFDHPSLYPVFSFGGKIWVVDDKNPEFFDTTSFNNDWRPWDTTKNPSISTSFTNGGGCAVVANDYAYWFAGKVVRQMYFIGMPTNDGLRVWETYADLTDTASSYCVVLPTNSSRIMLEVKLGTTTTYMTTIFDINLKTFTPVQSTTDLTGAPLLEICKSSDPVPLYAFPSGFYGTGVAKIYTPSGATIWPDVTAANSIGSITAGRNYPAVTLVPRTFTGLAALLPASCTAGC
jgi:hypothetical protein